MKITVDNFDDFADGFWDYDEERGHTGLYIHEANADIGGGKTKISDIDRLRDYPDADTLSISGLYQDTFEYFIRTYGHRLKAIRFFKNKFVEDWSLLGTLPKLEFVSFFANQRIEKLWDMSGNYALKGLAISDFTRLHSIEGIEKAPALEIFSFGDAVWQTSTVESFTPLAHTGIRRLSFSGKRIDDGDLSFLPTMKRLEEFWFAANQFTTEQVAWVVANCPNLRGWALGPTAEWSDEDEDEECRQVIVVGKRKPILEVKGNEERIARYVERFRALVERYRGVGYEDVPK